MASDAGKSRACSQLTMDLKAMCQTDDISDAELFALSYRDT